MSVIVGIEVISPTIKTIQLPLEKGRIKVVLKVS